MYLDCIVVTAYTWPQKPYGSTFLTSLYVGAWVLMAVSKDSQFDNPFSDIL
jgi:hypothetical protein